MRRVSLIIVAALLALGLTTGCVTRSISQAGYGPGTHYRGELSELAVLGVQGQAQITDPQIAEALAAPAQVSLTRGEALLLIQSGAQFPDEPMLRELGRHYRLTPLSGIPDEAWNHPRGRQDQEPPPSLEKALRLAAAKAGAQHLLVYWGILESGTEQHATKTVSWVPILGGIVPDQSQYMRIRLKAVLMDVKTGQWVMLLPPAYEDKRMSGRYDRQDSDLRQVLALKEKGYQGLVQEILRRW